MPRTMTAFKGTFEEALKAFSKATAQSMHLAGTCAQMALEHFSESGDLSYCQRFFDTMPANYSRRAAFVAWLVEFAPVVFEKQKFLKDKGTDAIKLPLTEEQVTLALKKPFWEFAPEAPIVTVTALDFDKALIAFCERWSKETKNRKIDMPTTLDHILDIEELVKSRVNPDALSAVSREAPAAVVH